MMVANMNPNELQVSEPKRDEDKVPLPIGLSFFLLVMSLLIYGAVSTYQWLQDAQRLPIQDIMISGQTAFTDIESLENEIRTQQAGSFFAIDVNDVHRLVENHPWVYQASVRKRWPSSLYIHITEQQPVALWNDDLMLNQYADSFEGNRSDLVLPSLFGPGGSEQTALEGYDNMRALLRASNLQIEQLILSERFAWTLQLKNGITLYLGREDYIKRLQRFIDVYGLLKEEKKAINYVDLRYDTGLAVGWAQSPTNSRAETYNNTYN